MLVLLISVRSLVFVGGDLLVFVSIACSCLLVVSVRLLVFVSGNLLVFVVSIAC